MKLRGPYPYPELTDTIASLADTIDQLATALNVPDPVGIQLGSTALPANVSAFTAVPGLVTPALTLPRSTWCLVSLASVVSGTVASFHYVRLVITAGDGSTITLANNGDQILWQNDTRAQHHVSRVVRVPGGATPVTVRAEYKTPAGTTASMIYPRLEIAPLRPAI